MEFSAQQIADFLKGDITGNPHVNVSDFAKIEEAVPGTLTFLSNMKYAPYLYSTKASIVLINKTFELTEPVSPTLIRVDDAYASLAMLLSLIEKAKQRKTGREKPVYVAESASVPENCYVGVFTCISENTSIGENTQIYPQVFIGENVTIGERCIIYPGVKIYAETRIGKNCILHAGAVIGSDGFGFAPEGEAYSKIPQIGIVEIEDNVEIGANATIDRATMGKTLIRKGVKLDNLVHIAHNVEVGENTVMAAQTGIAGSTKIGASCMFGGQVGISGHIEVGDNVKLGAQSGVHNSVKHNSTMMGTPALDARNFAKSSAVFKQLPELRWDIIQLIKNSDNNTNDNK
ncbi:MAG: UDP-3-O-(3-hydroxymyristoyl)glucosamine N-acyltransferase [Bacteroidales bacterium]|jgi:UDP-3-O-[3-hydroxymyristoyl] glucosamine N-acyltransferase|nr:UDP-3-O-(3-hydroxymyristoyl)glucosamine N-acyltransferase [Bacteroidales bacterium]